MWTALSRERTSWRGTERGTFPSSGWAELNGCKKQFEEIKEGGKKGGGKKGGGREPVALVAAHNTILFDCVGHVRGSLGRSGTGHIRNVAFARNSSRESKWSRKLRAQFRSLKQHSATSCNKKADTVYLVFKGSIKGLRSRFREFIHVNWRPKT